MQDLQVNPKYADPIPKGSNLPVKTHKKTPLWFKIAASISLLIGLGSASVAFEKHLPVHPSSFLGASDITGLKFQRINVEKEESNNSTELLINGEVINTSDHPLSHKNVLITLYSNTQEEMGQLEYELDKSTLNPDEYVEISPEIAGITEDAQYLTLDIGNTWELHFRKSPFEQQYASSDEGGKELSADHQQDHDSDHEEHDDTHDPDANH